MPKKLSLSLVALLVSLLAAELLVRALGAAGSPLVGQLSSAAPR